MKYLVVLVFAAAAIFNIAGIQAQNLNRCGSDAMFAQKVQSNPALLAQRRREDSLWVEFNNQPNGLRGGGVRTIPVVVHIIQSNAQIRISDERVQSQIDVMTEDFRKLNADTTQIPVDFLGDAGDTQIEFCLATTDPNGCPTNGINRIISPANANHDSQDEAQLKALIQWPPQKYLNIWVPESMPGLLGYATFPTQLTFLPQLDGVVINGQYFGRGFGTPPSSYALGRTGTHEVGHWLGLFHTFQDGCSGTSAANCSSQGDRICDTPPTAVENYGCPAPKNSCTETPVDRPDQLVNYMDYGDDPCLVMFSNGQGDRMNFILDNLRSQLVSSANLSATGCDGTPSAGCTPVAQFSANTLNACVGDTVRFTDLSVGPATQWLWAFQGGSPATSTDSNPLVTYSTPGTYPVSLQVGNALGTDSLLLTSYITISSSINPPVSEGFEGAAQLPTGWSTWDEDGAGTWEWTNLAASLGQNSVRHPNYSLTGTGSTDALVSEPYDFQNVASAWLTYDRAYKRRSAFAIDSFWVSVSTDCGNSWTRIRNLAGTTLISVTGLAAATSYVPGPNDWKKDSLDLSPFLGSPSVKIKFELKSGGGQNLYLDNINVDALVGRADENGNVQSLYLAPNPSSEELPTLSMYLRNPSAMNVDVLGVDGKILGRFATPVMGQGPCRISLTGRGLETLTPGVYWIRVDSGDRSSTLKWVKF